MTVFRDDFERSNGALGGNWADLAGTLSITGGIVYGTNPAAGYNTSLSDQQRVTVKVTVLLNPNLSSWAGPAVCMSPGGLSGYAAKLTYSGGNYTLAATKATGGSWQPFTSVSWASPAYNYYTLSIEWNSGTVTVTHSSGHSVSAQDTVWASGLYPGVANAGGTGGILDFVAITGAPPTLTVSPLAIPNYGACSTVTLTGTNTAWTPGTPGAPTITVDHGSISAQTINSATSATLTYCPGSYLGAVAFTDPSTGAIGTAIVTSDPEVVPPGSGVGNITQRALDWLDAQAGHGGLVVSEQDGAESLTDGVYIKGAFGELLLGKRATVGAEPVVPTDPALIWQLYRLLNGGYPSAIGPFPEPGYSTVDAGLVDVAAKLSALVGQAEWNLPELLFSLGGNPVKSNQDVLDAIGAIAPGSSQEVLDAVAALRGDTTTTVAELLTVLGQIRTVGTYSLGDVKSWIDALPHDSAAPTAAAVLAVVAALALAIPTGGASVAAEAVAIGAGPLLDLTTLVEIAGLVGTLADIASDILTIKNSLAPSTPTVPPVWTDLDHAIIGSSHDLADGLVIDGPLHGVIVDLSSAPSGGSDWTIGGEHTYYNWGQIGFMNDRGDLEPLQFLGWRKGFYLPRTMASASSAHFRVLRSPVGTVRAFTIT